jgi:putative MATE family efflux protein
MCWSTSISSPTWAMPRSPAWVRLATSSSADANLVFNQSVGMAVLCGIATLAAGYLFGRNYMNVLGADTETIAAGMTYLVWLLPGLALQFALISMGSALRGTGIVTPTIVVQILTVILNAVLAPILISGWLTGRALGMMGAGLATSISVAVGVVMMSAYFVRLEQYVRFDRTQIRPRMDVWRRILAIGVPPGGEFALMFVYMAFIFWISRPFGADAQAGFSAGTRVMQAIFLPAMAIAFATSPVAGQNFGAGLADRVRHTFRSAIASQSVIMISLTLLCQFHPEVLVAFFTEDAAVVAAGAEFLRIVSFNFLFSGIIFTCSGMFQALGNTIPALLATATRLITFIIPLLWISGQDWFQLKHVWYASVITVGLQAGVSWWLLHRKMESRLHALTPAQTESA